MSRRTKQVDIDAGSAEENRDFGKSYFITEMSASQAERWAMRAFLAIAKAGIEIPDDTAQAGMAGIASMGGKWLMNAIGGLPWDQAEPLLAEMMACVAFLPDPVNKPEFTRKMIEVDTEEVSTRFKLRLAVLELHTGFSLGAKRLTMVQGSRPNLSPA